MTYFRFGIEPASLVIVRLRCYPLGIQANGPVSSQHRNPILFGVRWRFYKFPRAGPQRTSQLQGGEAHDDIDRPTLVIP